MREQPGKVDVIPACLWGPREQHLDKQLFQTPELGLRHSRKSQAPPAQPSELYSTQNAPHTPIHSPWEWGPPSGAARPPQGSEFWLDAGCSSRS